MDSTVELAIPFPTPDVENREPPLRAEVELTVRGVATAAAPTGRPGGLTPVQRAVINALADSMTGIAVEAAEGEPLGPDEFAEALEDAWQRVCHDQDLYDRWLALERCPEGSLGLGVWRFYQARGFTFPGQPYSAPPTLAQHDWVHVLADYGSTVECEIEVFGLISRCNDDPEAFSLLAMVLGLFETGYFFDAANGFFEYDRGHISRDPEHMATRLADAMYRGAKLAWFLDDNGRSDETDLLATDWFAYADWSVDDVRTHVGLLPKSLNAISAGSVNTWEPGGISPFQLAHGSETAAAEGREYDAYGARPPEA